MRGVAREIGKTGRTKAPKHKRRRQKRHNNEKDLEKQKEVKKNKLRVEKKMEIQIIGTTLISWIIISAEITKNPEVGLEKQTS